MLWYICQLFSSNTNLVRKGPFGFGFMWISVLSLHENILKICNQKLGFHQWQDLCLFCSFSVFLGKWPTLRDSGDQTIWPTWTYGVPYERWYPYLSFGTVVSWFLTTGTATKRCRKMWPGLVNIKKYRYLYSSFVLYGVVIEEFPKLIHNSCN